MSEGSDATRHVNLFDSSELTFLNSVSSACSDSFRRQESMIGSKTRHKGPLGALRD